MPANLAERRRDRERHLISATRRLFDERGMQDAPVEAIAREVGINKALIYRQLASKEELFMLTLADYLDDLTGLAVDRGDLADPEALLRESLRRFTGFCLDYPAYLDCAHTLMRLPAAELRIRVADDVWLRLGYAMAGALSPLALILAAGRDQGVFAIDDADLVANRLYAQVLGTMRLSRLGVGVRDRDGEPELFGIDNERLRADCVEDAMALARIR
jgi:AcrR family transcriptional regulator